MRCMWILNVLFMEKLRINRQKEIDHKGVANGKRKQKNQNIQLPKMWPGNRLGGAAGLEDYEKDLVEFAERNWANSHVEMLKGAIQCVLEGKEVYLPIEEE